MNNRGIHFTNELWTPPGEDLYHRLAVSRPDTIKTLTPATTHFDNVAMHRRLKQEHPQAFIFSRLFADMTGGAWSADYFMQQFAPRIAELRGVCDWFEIHNEANKPEEWPGSDGEFVAWILDVLAKLRAACPWAKFVFPGQAVDDSYLGWWDAVADAVSQFDALGVHCYWQQDNWNDGYFGGCYREAHRRWPDMPIIITEVGDSTNWRTPAQKIDGYIAWYRELAKYDYVLGSALYILGGTDEWTAPKCNFDVTDDMAAAIGALVENVRPPKVHMSMWNELPFLLLRPLPDGVGRVTQWFGENPDRYARFGLAGHNGIDYGAPMGTSILAAHMGVCTTGNDDGGYGLYVKVDSWWGTTLYAHMSRVLVSDGQLVEAGQQIGEVGNTGNSTGPHLHFGVRVRDMACPMYGDYVDPLAFRKRGDEMSDYLAKMTAALEGINVSVAAIAKAVEGGVTPPGPVEPPTPPSPAKPELWDAYLDEIGVTIERRDGNYELIAGWHTESGNWDNVPTWAKRWQQDTLGGDHHLFGRCEDASGSAQSNTFALIWPGGGDQRGIEPDGWANIPMAGQNWNPANGPGPYDWFCFGGDKVKGLGMPHNWHQSFFFVWRHK